MDIIATDEEGNTFKKTIVFIDQPNGIVVSLGFPCQWYIDDIKEPPHAGDDKMYIDACGRNHKGSPVTCSHSELMTHINSIYPTGG